MLRCALSSRARGLGAFGIHLLAGLALISFSNAQSEALPAGSAGPKWVPLFTVTGIERPGRVAIAPQASRFRAVTINPLLTEAGGMDVGDRLFILPFEDGAVLGTVDRVETDVNGVVAVRARIAGTDGYLLLSSDREGRSLGRIVFPELRREFEISCLGGGAIHLIQEFAPGARTVLDDSPPLIPPSEPNAGPVLPPLAPANAAMQNVRIDCMIVYTPAARDFANTGSGIDNFVTMAMQNAQLGMDNSQVEVTLRLVYSALVNYTESGSASTDLSRLTTSGDGQIDEVHTWRNTYGADLVHLFIRTDETGGLGWLLNTGAGNAATAFCLGRVQQVATGFTTVHEWGHNMGCGHCADQLTQPGPGLFPYSSGWHWVGNDSQRYCSIMSYTDDFNGPVYTQVGYFSNPGVNYRGVPTGNATTADNVRTIREVKTVVSNYRVEAGFATLTITAGTGGTTNPAPGIYIYPIDSFVQVTAVPNTNFQFLAWSGSATGSQNPINITMNQPKAVTASFLRNIYAPANASGQRVLNRSLSQAEVIDIITFEANSNNVDILSYKIYMVKNGVKTGLGAVDANAFLYWSRRVDGSKEAVYQITAINGEGREGSPAELVIR